MCKDLLDRAVAGRSADDEEPINGNARIDEHIETHNESAEHALDEGASEIPWIGICEAHTVDGCPRHRQRRRSLALEVGQKGDALGSGCCVACEMEDLVVVAAEDVGNCGAPD